MSGSNEQQPQPPPDLNAAIQALIQQHIAAASGQGNQVQLPTLPAPQAQSQYSNDPDKGPDLLARIGLAIGGGSLPGAPAELRQQMGKQALLNFGIGLLGAGRFSTPGEALAGGLRGAQSGLLGSEAAQAGQQEYALNAQTELAKLGAEQQKNRVAALTALVPLMQMQQRLGLPPLYGPGSQAGPPGGGGTSTAGDGSYPTDQQPGWSYLAQLPPDMQKMVQAAAAQTGMPVELLAAHKWNESRGQSSVPAGDQGKSFGIMQMQQGALDDYNAKHGTKYTTADINNDPQLALNVGAGHWTDLQKQYGGNNFLASMAYARGPGATDAWVKGGSKYGELPPGVQRVLGNVYGPGSFPGATPIPEALALNQRGGPGGGQAGAPASPVGPYKVASRENVPPPAAAPPAPAQPATPPGVMSPGELPGASAPSPTPNQPAVAPPPAAQPQPPAQPPPSPAQPAPPAMTEYPGDVQASPEQYTREHYQAATSDEVARYAPGPTGAAARNAAQKVQDAQEQLNAARTQLQQIRNGQMPGDPNKAMSDVQAAQNELDKNRGAYDEEVQKLAESGSKNLLERDNAEKTRVSQNYQKVQDREQQNQQQAQTLANNIRLKEIEGEQQRITNREAVGNKVNQDTLAQASKDQIDARNLAVSIEGFQAMTGNMGQPGWLQTTKNPFGQGETIAEKLGQMGMPVNDTGGFQAMQAGINEMIKSLRAGMPMGSLSDRDLDFIRRMGPTEWMDPDTRTAVTSYIMQAARAKQRFSYEIQKNLSKPGANAADAIEAADAKVKSFVPEVPFSSSQWSDRSAEGTAKRMQWLQDHPLPPGTLYHLNDGSVMISKRPGAQQPGRSQGPAVGYGNQ